MECLRSGRDYFFQFDAGGDESPIGHFRTAPDERESPKELRFAVTTCQDWPSGFYTAYRDMLANDLDLVIHLGDYTYEYAINGVTGRGIPAPAGFEPETTDLRTYRLRHTLYRLDADLQAARAKFPFAVIWDDHEVQNDYSGLAPEGGAPSPEFTARRAAAYQAYYEHMPIRQRTARFPGNELRIYRRLRYGKLAEISLLDDRQYRSDNPCGDGESLRCEEGLSGDYTMLGKAQEEWLRRGFADSNARWNIVGQQLLLLGRAGAHGARLPRRVVLERRLGRVPESAPAPAERGAAGQAAQPGVSHRRLALDVRQRPEAGLQGSVRADHRHRAGHPAITTGGDGTPYGPYYAPMIPHNPHIKYYEGDKRGYFKARVTRKRMELDLRFVTSVERADGTGYTEKSFVVEDGEPGAHEA